MKYWIKSCGNTRLEDCQAALDAGFDALGFIFDSSPRQVTREQAAEITRALSPETETVGVFVNAPLEDIEQTVRAVRLRTVQLHGDESPDYVEALRQRLPGHRILKAVHAELGQYRGLGYFAGGEMHVDAILIDSGSAAGIRGGTGQVFDWLRLHDFIAGLQAHTPIIVAGGLTPENVSACLVMFHPHGVDAVSGLEAAPGKKDPEKLRAFVDAVRRAEKVR